MFVDRPASQILGHAGRALRCAGLAVALMVPCLIIGCGDAQQPALSLTLSSGDRISGPARATCAVPGKTQGAVEFALSARGAAYALNVHSRLYQGPGTYALSPGDVVVTYDESSRRPVVVTTDRASLVRAKEQALASQREWIGQSGVMSVASVTGHALSGKVDADLAGLTLHADFVCSILTARQIQD